MKPATKISEAPQGAQAGSDVGTAAAAHARMDPELKARWMAALRSGEYQQCRTFLRSLDDRYCCIGVLTDVVFPNEWEANGGEYTSAYMFRGRECWPAHFEDTVLQYSTLKTLTGMNDKQGKSFPEIADWIEANL